MAYEAIQYDVSDRVATVTLNRPDRLNAWTNQMEREVQEVMLASDADQQVRVIVLTGAGRGFCSGADMGNLDTMAKTTSPAEAVNQLRERFVGPKMRRCPRRFSKDLQLFSGAHQTGHRGSQRRGGRPGLCHLAVLRHSLRQRRGQVQHRLFSPRADR